jgi:glycosyltransferase involved in cell wall biosynthesis
LHLLAPDQANYFALLVPPGKLTCIPHGLTPQLLATVSGPELSQFAGSELPSGFQELAGEKKILLTVGNWLRDFEALLETARLALDQEDLLFVIVSRGLDLDTQALPNVLLLNQGLSDQALQALYAAATLLFLPLKDGAANNAILEAMARGIPIVATDIPAVHYYTNGLATVSAPEPLHYAEALQRCVSDFANAEERAELALKMNARARELSWELVATDMLHSLYAEPTVTGVAQPVYESSWRPGQGPLT